ncbi:MAG: hypothetical protein V3W18_03060 [candidate division Zixibacteria bacterium]
MDTSGGSIFSAYEIDEIGKRGKVQDALFLALEAIRAGIQDDDLYVVGASLAFQLGDLEKAGQLINALLARDPDHVNGWILFGQIHQAKGDIIRAGYGRSMAENLFPALNDIEIVVEELSQDRVSLNPKSTTEISGKDISFDTMTFAEICTRQGYYNKALKIYHDLLKKNPHDPEIKRRIEDLTKRLGND